MEGDRTSQQVIQLDGDEESSVNNTECVNKSLPPGTTATHNHRKKTRAEYQREYRQRIKAKQIALEADKIEILKKNRADYAKNLRARQKEMRQSIRTETETTQHDKLEQERKRKAANSKAYRERKKRLIDQSDSRKTEESTTAKIFAEPKQKSAGDFKARRGQTKLEKFAAEEDRILQNQRARDENTNYDETVQFVSEQSGENDQMQQRFTRVKLESQACNQLQTVASIHAATSENLHAGKPIERQNNTNKTEGYIRQRSERQVIIDYDEILRISSQSTQQDTRQNLNQGSFEHARHTNIVDAMEEDEFQEAEEEVDNDMPDNNGEHVRQEAETAHNREQNTNQTSAHRHTYSNYDKHVVARVKFHKQFSENKVGHICQICERLWFEKDLKSVKDDDEHIISKIIEKSTNATLTKFPKNESTGDEHIASCTCSSFEASEGSYSFTTAGGRSSTTDEIRTDKSVIVKTEPWSWNESETSHSNTVTGIKSRTDNMVYDIENIRDEHLEYGEYIADRFRESNRNKREIHVAKKLIDDVMLNLSIGRYRLKCITETNAIDRKVKAPSLAMPNTTQTFVQAIIVKEEVDL